ncbi:MAG: HEPN domain-containing protein [Thermodesulfobacteriota bacterium]
MKEIAKKWLKQALHDLRMAEKNIEIEGYDVASFLAHQAVEKLLKAIFALEGKRIPKTHYIDDLAQELNVPAEVKSELLTIIPDYTLARYPDVSEETPYEQYNEKIAREKVASAKRIFELLKDRYNTPTEDGA